MAWQLHATSTKLHSYKHTHHNACAHSRAAPPGAACRAGQAVCSASGGAAARASPAACGTTLYVSLAGGGPPLEALRAPAPGTPVRSAPSCGPGGQAASQGGAALLRGVPKAAPERAAGLAYGSLGPAASSTGSAARTRSGAARTTKSLNAMPAVCGAAAGSCREHAGSHEGLQAN